MPIFFQMISNLAMSNRNIAKYYETKFGKPERHADFHSPDGNKIDIFKWSESQTNEGVVIYATAGASHILGDTHIGCEFFLGTTQHADEVVYALAEVALHGSGNTAPPTFGDSISLTYNLWQGTEAKSFLFTNGDEIIPPNQIGLKKLRFIQLIPLFDTELAYKKTHGETALWTKFEELLVPYWSTTRKAAF
jgi:hypothetical protein